ncbi:hypothetical protein EDB19DRAFT_1941531, partial [Suillus lakei]
SLPPHTSSRVSLVKVRRHNLAGTVYQSSKYGGVDDSEDGEREEGWKQLEEQMFRRWELFAVCYSKMGDRKLTCDAFVESVKAFPYGSSGLGHLGRSATPSSAFSANASTKQLGGIIDRLTYAATCELFLPLAEVSLLTARKPGVITDEVLGLLLERQISTLEPCLRKDSMQIILRGLLRDALSVYKATVIPLHRARVLLKCMEFLLKDGDANGGETCWTAKHLCGEVLQLLAVEDLVHDSAFVPFRLQHTVAVHLWLRLFVYRSTGSPMTSTMSYHVEEACNVLCGLVPNSPTETNPKTKRSP